MDALPAQRMNGLTYLGHTDEVLDAQSLHAGPQDVGGKNEGHETVPQEGKGDVTRQEEEGEVAESGSRERDELEELVGGWMIE